MEELRKALFAFLNTQPAPVIGLEDGKVIFTNPAAARLAPDIMGADARELFGEELAAPGASAEGTFRGEMARGTDLGGLRLITVSPDRLPRIEDYSIVDSLVSEIHSTLSAGIYRIQDVMKYVRPAGDHDYIQALASMDRSLCRIIRMAHNLGRVYGDADAQPKMSLLDLEGLVQDLLTTASLLIEERGVRLELSSSKPVELYGDRRLLEIMLTELLSNAIKFSRAGDAVTVSVSTSGRLAFIKVTDSGRGEDPARLNALRKLHDLPPSVLDPDAGLGLGLHVARNIAALHGGNIILRTLPDGAGTTVIAALPLTEPPGDAYFSEPDETVCTTFDLLIEMSDVADESIYEKRDTL